MSGRRRVYVAGLLAILAALLALALLLPQFRAQDLVVASMPLGMFPGAVVMDDRTGRAFIANDLDTSVNVLDSGSGTVLRRLTVGSNGGAHPEAVVVDSADNHAFVATDDGLVSMLDASSGALISINPLGGSALTLATDGRHRIFVANADSGVVSTLDAGSGRVVHTSTGGSYPMELGVDDRTRRVFVADAADDIVTMLDATSGAPLRAIHVGFVARGMVISVPLGRVFLAAPDASSIRVLDARSGAQLRPIALNGSTLTRGKPVVAVDDRTEHLFVAIGTHVSMLDARTGRLLSRAPLGSRVVAMAIDDRGSRCLAVTQGAVDSLGRLQGNGAVVALDTRTGMARRMVAVGVGPRSIGLDERQQRALVVNTALNPDGSFADPPAPQGAWTWTERIPWVGSWLSRFDQPRPAASPNGQGSVTVLDLSRL